MQSCGMKRPLSDWENICQEDSPEYLLPVKDPYSSEDEKPRSIPCPSKHKTPDKILSPGKKIFRSTMCSCNITATEFLFFFDMDFTLIDEEINISEYSTEEILKTIFTFISDSQSDNDNKTSKWKNKTISDIYKNAFNEIPILSWIAENDTIDIKKSPDEYENFEEKWKWLYEIESEYCDKKASYLHWLHTIKGLNECLFEHQEVMKLTFYQIREIAEFPPFKGDGAAQYQYVYRIPLDLASEDSDVFETRDVCVKVHPASVFMVRGRQGLYDLRPKLLLEVCSPKDFKEDPRDVEVHEKACSVESISSAIEMCNQTKTEIKTVAEMKEQYNNVSFSRIFQCKDGEIKANQKLKHLSQERRNNKPTRKQNGVYNKEYVEQVRQYLGKRVPSCLTAGNCVKKLVAQHSLQLLSIALCNRQENNNMTVIGMFIKKERIFFSKLCITKERLDDLVGYFDRFRDLTDFRTRKKIPPGVISYSSWYLDVTKPNHRIALLIFMREYLKTEHHF